MYDTHAHLAEIQDDIVERAKAEGLRGVIAVSSTAATCEATLRLRERHPGFIHAALGVHPTEFFNEDLNRAIEVIRANRVRCVAVGEIGLDYWHKLIRKDKAQKGRQTEYYIRQLTAAMELDLPVSIHSRGAWRDCLYLALKHGPGRGVFHWYSGPLDILDDIIDAGYFVSCTPALEGSPELRAAMKRSPLERILVETDSPVWIKNLIRPSEPADVKLTIKHLAELKGLPREDVEAATAKNAELLFGL
jgi:TatD DNase family protein